MNKPGQRRMNHPLNARVSANLRNMRMGAGMTQREIAAHLGVSFQQIQKYESGDNRTTPAVIVGWTRACRRDIAAAFAGIDDPATPAAEDPIALRATHNLMRLANAMPVKMRCSLVYIARNLLAAGPAPRDDDPAERCQRSPASRSIRS